MPETQHFMSRGRGNGFPYCPAKVNVADNDFDDQPYEFWTTLSGWSKVDEPATDELKEASIAESHALAVKLFWNVDGYAADSICTTTWFTGDGTAELTFPIGSADATSGSLREPAGRVCIPDSEKYTVVDNAPGDPFTTATANCGAPEIIRMYNGDVLDEDNFVGYGIKSDGVFSFYSIPFSMGAGEDDDFRVGLESYVDHTNEGEVLEIGYTEMNGMHFVCWCEDYHHGGITVADPENRSISYNLGSPDFTAHVVIDEFVFYTYPPA